jgi:nitroreductase/FMN reductase [NAD(P)H]
MRLPPSVVVHWDRYDDAKLAHEVDAYDRRRHERHPIPPGRQRHVERYGEAAFYGWSENAARQLSLPERAGFRDFLKGHGFDLA